MTVWLPALQRIRPMEGLSSGWRSRSSTADEGETGPEFQEELTDVGQEAALQFPLVSVVGKGEEIEVVGILQGLLGQVGLRRGRVRVKLVAAWPCRR